MPPSDPPSRTVFDHWSASDYGLARSVEHPSEHADRARVVDEREPLERRVVVPAVPRTVCDHRASPGGREDIHVARAALLLERRLTARIGDGARERARERARPRGTHGVLHADRLDRDGARVQRRRGSIPDEGFHLALERARIDARRQAIADAQLRALGDAVVAAGADPLEAAVETIERARRVSARRYCG